ncbi:MAG: hypothetical protein IJN74_00010 [Clostridia bacterium]|nr:hypothetical protein [Clostridia bacterium]
MQKRKTLVALIFFIVLILSAYFIGSGFVVRNDVVLTHYEINADGTEITLHTSLMSPMGFIRGYKNMGGGVKPHYLKFYATFGGVHSEWGAKSEYTLPLAKDVTEIYFSRPDGGYALVLQKDAETGEWVYPNKQQ